MNDERSAAAPAPPRCPTCRYNLTGLPQPRCPECGGVSTWEQAHAAGCPQPIAFERARGWGRVPGFVVTWLTVMFAPWHFARQAAERISGRAALAFGAVCFLSTLASVAFGADGAFIATWLLTAGAYLAAQTVWLSVLALGAPRERRGPRRYWLLIGGYTSAVMMTEFASGPPQLLGSELLDLLLKGKPPELWGAEPQEMVQQAQLLLWSFGVACCFAARVAERRRLVYAGVTTGVLLSLIGLYAVIVENVGGRLYVWIADPFPS